MKKIIATTLVLLMTLALFTACGKIAECDFCGETGPCKTETVFGEEINICNDCMDELDDLQDGLGDLTEDLQDGLGDLAEGLQDGLGDLAEGLKDLDF